MMNVIVNLGECMLGAAFHEAYKKAYIQFEENYDYKPSTIKLKHISTEATFTEKSRYPEYVFKFEAEF